MPRERDPGPDLSVGHGVNRIIFIRRFEVKICKLQNCSVLKLSLYFLSETLCLPSQDQLVSPTGVFQLHIC